MIFGRAAGRSDEAIRTVLLRDAVASMADMATCIIVGSAQTRQIERAGKVYKTGPETGCGPVLQKLYNAVQGIQDGEKPDTHGWNVEIE